MLAVSSVAGSEEPAPKAATQAQPASSVAEKSESKKGAVEIDPSAAALVLPVAAGGGKRVKKGKKKNKNKSKGKGKSNLQENGHVQTDEKSENASDGPIPGSEKDRLDVNPVSLEDMLAETDIRANKKRAKLREQTAEMVAKSADWVTKVKAQKEDEEKSIKRRMKMINAQLNMHRARPAKRRELEAELDRLLAKLDSQINGERKVTPAVIVGDVVERLTAWRQKCDIQIYLLKWMALQRGDQLGKTHENMVTAMDNLVLKTCSIVTTDRNKISMDTVEYLRKEILKIEVATKRLQTVDERIGSIMLARLKQNFYDDGLHVPENMKEKRLKTCRAAKVKDEWLRYCNERASMAIHDKSSQQPFNDPMNPFKGYVPST